MSQMATAQTHWVHTQMGYDYVNNNEMLSQEQADQNLPNTPVSKEYLKDCPRNWVTKGWVKEYAKEIPATSIEKVIAELWAKCHEHTEGYQNAESLFEQKRDEGAAEAFEFAANRLQELLKSK